MSRNRQELIKLLNSISASDAKSGILPLDGAFEKSIEMILGTAKKGGKLIFIGNGGSASIASHMVTDFVKNAGIAAIAFNDPSLLTCISNDCGYEQVFEKPISVIAGREDLLIAISSSGKSENILRGVKMAKKKGAKVITLSGFAGDNPLRKLGEINFYAPSSSYGHVEIAHLAICHSMVDAIVEKKNG